MNNNNLYILNPAYKFRFDVKRAIITNNNSSFIDISDPNITEVSTSFTWTIHPIVAYLFSLFNGKNTINDVISIVSTKMGVEHDTLSLIINKYIYNKENMIFPIKGLRCFSLPKNLLIKMSNDNKIRKEISYEDVIKTCIDIDILSKRLYIPNDVTFMVNNKCVTDCEYCYANKDYIVDKPLSFLRVKELIKEASRLNLRDFNVGGGEFFLYENWEELLIELNKHNFTPYISTKYPINEPIIYKLKKLNVKSIQVSLDTVDNNEIKNMIHVPDSYLEKMKHAIKLLNDNNIEITVKPVITKYNDSLESVNNLLTFLVQYKMVKNISIAPGTYSIYKPFTFSSTPQKISEITQLVNEFSKKYNIVINVQGANEKSNTINKIDNWKNRSLCSGNLSSFYILPDGKVTLCEQIYWHPFFILGDLKNSSIMDVWNSEKAHALWNFSQDEVSNESPCKNCSQFEECRRGLGNCWRFAIAAYGEENYDFPSPDCPFAPEVKKPYYMV